MTEQPSQRKNIAEPAGAAASFPEWARDSEAQFRSLVETVPAVVYMDDYEDTNSFLYISPQVEGLLGYAPTEFLSDASMWRGLIHPDDRDRVFSNDELTNRTGSPWSMEYRLIANDGRAVWVHDEAMIVRDESGAPLCWQGVWIDITAQRETEVQLRTAEAKYRSLVEQIPAVIYVDRLDDPATGLYVSPQAEEILGISPEEFRRDPTLWYDHLHPDDRLRVVQEWRQCRETGQPLSTEYRILAPGARVVWVNEQARVLRDDVGKPWLVQGVMMDITDRKRVEEELERAWQRERQSSADLRALDRMKNTLLHAVSHDLRGPISAVIGSAALLREHDGELTGEEREQLIAGLESSANKMNRIVTDLLDMDRIDRGIIEPKCEPVDVGELVTRVVDELDLTDDRKIELEVEHLVVSVDAARVERIVENLVLNAVRHTPEAALVWVRVIPGDDEGVVIAVEDAGPGVPEELRGTIFQPFRRGPDEGPYAGSGIGLSLVARFAELHGGQAWVQERAGGGASFRVFLPDAGRAAKKDSPVA